MFQHWYTGRKERSCYYMVLSALLNCTHPFSPFSFSRSVMVMLLVELLLNSFTIPEKQDA